MTRAVGFGLTFMLMACAACSSKPIHFYVLTPTAAAAEARQSPPYPIQVAAFHIPPTLDRPQLVRRNRDNGLTVDDQNRWGAAVGEMARNVLAEDLRRRLPAGAVVLPEAPAPSGAAQLVVNTTQFNELPDGHVRLLGSWSLMGAQAGAPIITREIALTHQADDDGPAAQAAAMSALLGKLADSIARDLTDLSRP